TATYFTITGSNYQNVIITTVNGTTANWILSCPIANVNVSFASLSYSTESPRTATANNSTLVVNTPGWQTGVSTTTWIGGTAGFLTSWNTAGNWSNGLPSATVAALIVPATYQPTLDTNPTVMNLTIASNATLTMAGLNITRNSAGTITV